MSLDLPLPGSPYHQKLLETIIALYESRDELLGVVIYGSLGKGNWDDYSDLDISVVVKDDTQVDLANEVERVSSALTNQGEQILFTEAAGEDIYVVPKKLIGINIAYHTLKGMSPYVLEGSRVLCGTLNLETIHNAAQGNVRPKLALSQQLHRALWLALGADIALQRRQFWRTLPTLEPMRGALVDIFGASRGGKRVIQLFEEEASAEMKALFGLTFPQYFPDSTASSLRSIGDAFSALLNLLEHHLAELSNHQLQLSPGEREFINQLRSRQKTLHNDTV